MDRRSRLALVLLIVVILVGFLSIVYVEVARNRGPFMVLEVPLPAERPEMRILTIDLPGIGNSTDARDYASKYFPEFADIEFEDRGDESYQAETDAATIIVHSSGKISYTLREVGGPMLTDSLPYEVASNISEGFIEAHGGKGSYAEYKRHTAGSVDDDGNYLNILYRLFIYHRKYDGYWVLGDDGLTTMVFAETRTVSLGRASFILNATNESRKVISAHVAWDALVESMDGGGPMDRVSVSSIELCYYVDDNREGGAVAHTAWRFHDPDWDYFVDALTGDVLSGGHRTK